ncbi:hypothetical protein BGX38DRAFT_528799 [Terfezia claveryi]|nr:hypothetical protein BGX38DRAFT_528799 [Terfezia claveryi]
MARPGPYTNAGKVSHPASVKNSISCLQYVETTDGGFPGWGVIVPGQWRTYNQTYVC